MAQLPRLRRGARTGAGGIDAPFGGDGLERRAGPDVEHVEFDGLTWYHGTNPGTAETEWLRERFAFDELALEDVLSTRQRPKVDEYPDVVFVILHFPRYDKRTKRLNVAEVNAFVGPDYVITMPTVSLKPLDRLFHSTRENEAMRVRHMSKGSGYLLYEIVDELFQYCFPIVDRITYKLDRIEDDLEEVMRGEHVGKVGTETVETAADILGAKLEIINYRRILKPQRPILNQLERTIRRFLPQDLDLYFDDIVDKSERIWDVLEASVERVEAMEDAHETLIAHRNNEQLRILTLITVLLAPGTVITGIFGQNVLYPGVGTHWGFWVSVGIIVSCIGALVIWFRRRGWL